MRIAQVCPLFPFHGGMETHIKEISNRLIEEGINVEIYTTDPSGKLPKKQTLNEVRIFRFKSLAPNNTYFFSPKLFLAIRQLKEVDIIHAHGYPNFPALAAALAKNEKPLVFTPHHGGYDVHAIGTSRFRTFLKRCYNSLMGKYMFDKSDLIATVSEFEKDFLKRKFGVHKEKIKYVPNGVDVERFRNQKREERDIKTILYVGRLEKYKGVHFLIRAFQKVKRSFPDSRMIIVGAGTYKQKLIALTHDLKVQKHVMFLENVSDERLTQLYLSAALFVMLSQYEGVPIALIEAMAYGLPVISTNVGGIPELIHPYSTGFLLDFPPDENTLVEHITRLLGDTDRSNQIGLQAQNVIFSTFSWNRTVRELIGIYTSLL